MNSKHRISLSILGFVIWMIATVTYHQIGSYFFEGSALGYWLNVILTGILYAGISLGVIKWQGIEQKDWLQGVICIALPGMIGEIPILAYFSELMSNMQPETAERYAAFLFGGYSSLIGIAGLMSRPNLTK